MYYCPVCKRQSRQSDANHTGLCPVCGSKFIILSDEELERVRKDEKNDPDNRGMLLEYRASKKE